MAKNLKICEKLKELRESQNISISELSEKSGVCSATIYLYEAEKRVPNILTINKIAKALNVDIEEIL